MLVFGFDIGTTSIGSAVIEFEPEAAKGMILRLGVRIFPEARDPKGTPLNQQRRTKRMMRRQTRRRKSRRRALNEALAAQNLLPPFSKDKDSAWAKIMEANPYELRKKGLREPLAAYELGRALYHLAKLRHFKGRDIDEGENDGKEDPDEKTAQTNRDATLQSLRAANTTLGAWLADKPDGDRKRGIHATREVVEEEFRKLWIAQSPFHPVLRNPGFIDDIENIVFAQKPVFWRKSTLGRCRLEPEAELCPKASWLSQQRRMLEMLNNLTFAGGNQRTLEPEERAVILRKLQTQGSMTWGGVRNTLEPLFKARSESARSIKFNLEVSGDKKPSLLGNPLEAKLADIFGDAWSAYPLKGQIREQLPALLLDADFGNIGTQRVVIRSENERKKLRRGIRDRLIRELEVTEAQADALAAIKLPTGWDAFSTSALKKMLPQLEQGVRFGTMLASPEKNWVDWRNTNFPSRVQPTGELLDRLPSPSPKNREEERRIAQIRNPTVVRAQNELRKVVNNLIGLYGKPDVIRVELARDMGKSKREREEISTAMRKQERRRKDARSDLQSKEIQEPTDDDVEKWLLWKEGQERCPYTGDQISFDDLFRNGRFQVEHIWPKSRTLDNSFRNKTLCRIDINQKKGNKTPFEFFEHKADEWTAIKDRLDRMLRSGEGLSAGKIKRFLAETLPDDFAARQLNDTGYAARQAIEFLKRLWPDVGSVAPVNVQAVSGRVTGQLRKRWELNYILGDDGEKTRADHRHHAIDALTVACAHAGYVKRLSDHYKEEEAHRKPPILPKPWLTIRHDADASVKEIVVSHRVRKKVSGPLHDEQAFGYTHNDIIKKGTKLGVYVRRMPVEKLSLETLKINRVEDISRRAKFVVRDETVRRILLQYLEAANKPPEKAYPPYPRVTEQGPEIRKVRVLATQQKDLMVPVTTGFADPANNHHIAIYRLPDESAEIEVVSLFKAAGRLSKREPVIRRNSTDGAKFVMSLSPGDALEFRDGKKSGIWIVQGAWASGQVVIQRHTDAIGDSKIQPAAGSFLKENARKITIDPIGRVSPARD